MNLWDMFKASKGISVSEPMAKLCGYQYRKKHGFSELSGIPPLNFISRDESLQDYRIDGNTLQNNEPAPDNPAVVQGCGEKTQNIITCGFENGSIRYPSGELFDSDERIRTTDFIPIDAGTYTLSWTAESDIVAALFYYGENKNLLCRYPEVLPFKSSPCTFSPISSTKYFKIIFMHDGGEGLLDPSDVTNIMINLGSSASSYEPYGYKIPVTVANGAETITTPVYIGDEPLYEGEYVSFSEQKIYRFVNEVLTPVSAELPAIQTIQGTNILTVGTTVQPCEVYVKGKIKLIT